jgi:NADPH:quinone reductase-like Zn-dependent oxidoreductase
MRAVRFAAYGEPDVLHVVEVDEPHAEAGQIRVAVRAAGVNPFDCKLRSGALQQMMPVTLPAITGGDVAGIVDEIGDGVSDLAIGDEVFGFAVSGGAAQYAVVDQFAVKPPSVSWEVAAGLPLVVETAVRTLDVLGVKAGSTVLINGAAGGVGVAATQFARGRGAAVIGTASPNNHDFLRSLGATPTTYGEGLVARVREIGPVDLALDAAGFGALPDLIELTGSPDNVVTIADYAAATYGVRLSPGPEGRAFHALGEVATLLAQGAFTMPVRTFPLARVADAHIASQHGHLRGKLVLTLDDR